MSLRYLFHDILPWFQARFGWMFQIVEIVDLSCWMILRHVEAVVIDERGLDQRSNCLSEPERDELSFDHSQESQVWVIFSRIERRDGRGYVVCPKTYSLPVTGENHLAR